MSGLSFFRLEFAALAGVVLIYIQHRQHFLKLSNGLKLVHFAFVCGFSIIGVGGLRAAIKFCFGNESFFDVFGGPNLLSIPGEVMPWVACGYALIGTVFFVAVMFLGELKPTGRRVFVVLAIPCSVFYPVIMANLMGVVEHLDAARWGRPAAVITFGCFGGIGVGFYRSQLSGKLFGSAQSQSPSEPSRM